MTSITAVQLTVLIELVGLTYHCRSTFSDEIFNIAYEKVCGIVLGDSGGAPDAFFIHGVQYFLLVKRYLGPIRPIILVALARDEPVIRKGTYFSLRCFSER